MQGVRTLQQWLVRDLNSQIEGGCVGDSSCAHVCCYKETRWLGMDRQSETRAGKHRRHTRTRNASLPTQANHTARGARKQPPNQGAIHAASEDTIHTSHHTACHQCDRRRYASTAPTAGATGTSPAHT